LHEEEQLRSEDKLVDLTMQISASDSETTNEDGPRTVHAKDQMSLARVGGGLTEWTTSSNMSSGAQTAAGVQKGRNCSSTRVATYCGHPNADDGHAITVLTIAKIHNFRSQRCFMKGGILASQVLHDRNRWYKISRERLRVRWVPLRKNNGAFRIAKVI